MILKKRKKIAYKKRRTLFLIVIGCVLSCLLLKSDKGETDRETNETEDEWAEWK